MRLHTGQNPVGLDSHAQVLPGSELLQHCGPAGRGQPPGELLQVSASEGRGLQGGGAQGRGNVGRGPSINTAAQRSWARLQVFGSRVSCSKHGTCKRAKV